MEENKFECPKCKKQNCELEAPNWMMTRNPIISVISHCLDCGCKFQLVISLSHSTILEENILNHNWR